MSCPADPHAVQGILKRENQYSYAPKHSSDRQAVQKSAIFGPAVVQAASPQSHLNERLYYLQVPWRCRDEVCANCYKARLEDC